MLCSVCKEKEATVYYTNIADGKTKNVNLCEDCAKAKGINESSGFSLADLMLGLGASQEMEEAGGGAVLKCPRCGYGQDDFKKSGRLGCPDCYKVFAEGLDGLLKTMHKGTKHIGKVPEALRQNRDLSERLKTLQKRLTKAVEGEDFEQAAKLRDEIKQTSAKLSHLTPT
ncbi:MAG: UvrB/UvrC motif-containing protein [Verrucomicrobiota bacterium]